MTIKRGRYQVIRMCCSSGNCFDCHGCWDKTRRIRSVVLDRLSKATAETVARNWALYDAVVERMPKR